MLENVDFSFSNLSRARFTGAQLRGVNFERAYTYLTRFDDQDLRQVQNLTQIQIDLACGNLQTRLPEGRRIPDSWPCKD